MSGSSTDRFRRADAIFDAALDLPDDEQTAYVARACADDDELRVEVLELLRDAEAEAERDATILHSPGHVAVAWAEYGDGEPESEVAGRAPSPAAPVVTPPPPGRAPGTASSAPSPSRASRCAG